MNEPDDLMFRFMEELLKATADGQTKRRAGEKPPWFRDDTHEAAMFSHLSRWKRGELVDPNSGAHPLVHLAWRALAIACREAGNVPDDRPSLRGGEWRRQDHPGRPGVRGPSLV